MPDPSLNPTQKPDHEPLPTVSLGSVKPDTDSRRTQSTDIGVKPAAATNSKPSAAPAIPGYVITGEIARGGMGQVFAGRDLTLDREVAIKTLLPGANAERFIIESKITAKLPHPGIPPVHALGMLSDGAPYLAMKLIRGRTLAANLKERSSPQDDLPHFLQIFEQIAQAVGFAHAQGIIHRDLKPANIMVGAFGEVQVMDWGLAKELGGQNVEGRRQNEAPGSTSAPSVAPADLSSAGSVCGTPGYMSPEQARGEPVDARTDVFALGSILAMILTGKPAFVGKTVPEIMKQTALADLSDVLARLDASSADAGLTTLAKRYLAGDANERPENAQSVATEVAAYRAAVGERLRLAELQVTEALVREAEVRKRRKVWLCLAAVLLLGIAATSVFAWQAHQSYLAEQKATVRTERQLTQIKNQNETIISIFKDLNMDVVRNGTEPLEAVLAKRLIKAADELQGDAIGDPVLVAEMQNKLAHSLMSLGHHEPAINLLQQALRTFEARLGPEDPATLQALSNLALGYRQTGKGEIALPMLEKTLSMRKASLGPHHQDTINSMNAVALAYLDVGKSAQALSLLEEAVELSKATFGLREKSTTLNSMNNLALAYRSVGKLSQGLELYEEVLKLRREELGPDHPNTLLTMHNLANNYQEDGKLDLALPLIKEVLRLHKAKLGSNHPSTLHTMNALAAMYREAGQPELAVQLYEETLQLRKDKLGGDHPDSYGSMQNLALGYQAAGKPQLALPLMEEAVKLIKAKLGADHPDTLVSLNNLASVYSEAGKPDRALPILEETLKIQKEKLGADHPSTLASMSNLAGAYTATGQRDQAQRVTRELLELAKSKLGADHPHTLTTRGNLAKMYYDAGKIDLALPLMEEALQLSRTKPGPDHPDTLTAMSNLADVYRAAGKLDLAIPLIEEAVKLRTAKLGANHPHTLNSLNIRAWIYKDAGQTEKAVALFDELRKMTEGSDHSRNAAAMLNLATTQLAANKVDEATVLFERILAEKVLKRGPRHPETLSTYANIGFAYAKAGVGDKAETHLKEFVTTYRQLAENPRSFAQVLPSIGSALLHCGQPAAAEEVLREALPIFEKEEPESPTIVQIRLLLGEALLSQKKNSEAEVPLQRSYEALQNRMPVIIPKDPYSIPSALDRLIKLYTALDKPEEVTKWRAEREKYPVAKDAAK